MIEGAIEPYNSDTEELSMKAPMLMSKPADLGYYLNREGLNLGKHRVPSLLLPLALDAQFGTPYLRSTGFDTDIGAFIESSSVSSL